MNQIVRSRLKTFKIGPSMELVKLTRDKSFAKVNYLSQITVKTTQEDYLLVVYRNHKNKIMIFKEC